jgi:hypothetical protein
MERDTPSPLKKMTQGERKMKKKNQAQRLEKKECET